MAIISRILHNAGEAIHKHRMIKEGDNILIAFSGGKDSYALLEVLQTLQKKAPIKFSILAVIIDQGFKEMNYRKVEDYFNRNKINYHIKKTIIADIVKKKSPRNCCFLCSRLRRGIIYKLANKLECNKIALGHNLDDSMQTLLLNIMYSSKLEALKPRYISDDKNNIIIRPLINVRESDIQKLAKEKKYPIVKQKCFLKKQDSKREMIKKILNNNAKENKFLHSSMKNIIEKIYKLKQKP